MACSNFSSHISHRSPTRLVLAILIHPDIERFSSHQKIRCILKSYGMTAQLLSNELTNLIQDSKRKNNELRTVRNNSFNIMGSG